MKAAGAGPVRCPPLTVTVRGAAAPALHLQPQSHSSALQALQHPPPALAMPPSRDRHVRQKVFQALITCITGFCCIADHNWPPFTDAVTHLVICTADTSHLVICRYFLATAWRSTTAKLYQVAFPALQGHAEALFETSRKATVRR